MLDNEMKHPSMTEIMEFVCLRKEELKPEIYAKYFGMVSHLVKCRKCSRIKEEMQAYVDFVDKSLAAAMEKKVGMVRVFRALGGINKADILKERDVILNVRAMVSKTAGKSGIFVGGLVENLYKSDSYTDERNNTILLEQEKISVVINDGKKNEMSLLVMSQNEEKEPIFKDMERIGESWEISCDCPEDEYDIVVL